MNKYYFLFGLVFLAIFSCENDDFCTEETTPRMIISFYDIDSPEEYKEIPIYAWADGKDSIYQLAQVDSIYLPLNTADKKVVYKLATLNVVDDLNFSYDTENEFVSESCGYRTIFKNLKIESATTNWIGRVEVSNANVENENLAHVKIYY
jgi:hypothetical protein